MSTELNKTDVFFKYVHNANRPAVVDRDVTAADLRLLAECKHARHFERQMLLLSGRNYVLTP